MRVRQSTPAHRIQAKGILEEGSDWAESYLLPRLNDIVVLVLSEASVNSNGVKAELAWAREKEKNEKQNVLCPITIGGASEAKFKAKDVLWRQAFKKHVLDFLDSQNDEAFEGQFAKLLKDLKQFYPPAPRQFQAAMRSHRGHASLQGNA